MKKRYIPIIMTIVLISGVFFTACKSSDDENNPKEVTRMDILKEFTDISAIPRNNGGDMSKISKYLTDHAKALGLSSKTDSVGNILIEKPAAQGYENVPVTILQTNMDMIVKSSPSIIFDPAVDGITPVINEDTGTITGTHTNLGASSGFGMATALYILENVTECGPIKAVFTVDGEGNMDGARNIDPSFIQGDYLINLNNVKSNDIQTGSAYSSVLNAVEKTKLSDTKNKYSLVLVADGFTGGDSGVASQNQQGNPIIFLAEVLAQVKSEGLTYELNDFEGGDNPTSLPRSAKAVITVNDYEKGKVGSIFNKVKKTYLKEHSETDPEAFLDILETTVPQKALDESDVDSLISYLYGIVDGKYNDENDKVTASSNVCTVNVQNDNIVCGIFAQSKLESALDKMIADHSQIAKISNMTLTVKDDVNGYSTGEKKYLPASLSDIYKSVTGQDADFSYKTSRTELGFFYEKNTLLELVSIGPTIEHQNKTTEYAKLDTVGYPAMAVMDFLTGQQ